MDTDTPFDYTHFGMGTEIAHRAYGENAKTAMLKVEKEAERLESVLSRFVKESDVDRINKNAGIKHTEICSETFDILFRALHISKISNGLFDPSLGPLIDLWNYKHSKEAPENDRIKEALSFVGYSELELDEANMTAGLRKAGRSIDLGGIAKGYASDCFMEVFKKNGVESAFSNIGGNVSTLGLKPDGSPWRVGIRHPRQDGLIGAVETSGSSVVTSGDYERYFIDSRGRLYHHILNPKTGYPAKSGLISVTVVAESAMDADALSTAVFIAGMEKGLEIMSEYPQAGLIMIDENICVHVTENLKQSFCAFNGVKTKTI